MNSGWNKYAHRAYDELSAEDSQQQQDSDELDDLLDARDNLIWSGNDDDDFEDMRLDDQDETSELSDIEEEMESIDLQG